MSESIMVMENGKWKEKTYEQYGEELTTPSKNKLTELKGELKKAKEKRKAIKGELAARHREISDKVDALAKYAAEKGDPAMLDRVRALMQRSPVSDPARLQPQEYIDGKPRNYSPEVPKEFMEIVDAHEAATGVPRILNQFEEYQGITGTEPRKRADRGAERYKNLAQFMDDANESLPVIWKYKDKPMNTLGFMMDNTLLGDVDAGLFNSKDLTFELSPDFVSDNPGEAMRVHKMADVMLALRRRLAQQGVDLRNTDVGPNGERVHNGETLVSQMTNYVPAVRDVVSNVRVRKMEDGTKKYGTYTMDELVDQQIADLLGKGDKADALVGLDVGRGGPTKRKQFVRYLTGEEGKKAGYLTGDKFISALDKSLRRQDEFQSELKRNHDYNVQNKGTHSLIEPKEMILIDEVWRLLPKEGRQLTKSSLRRVDASLVENISKKLTEIAQDPDGHMRNFGGAITPEEVWGVIDFINADPLQSFLTKKRPTVTYRQVPSNKIPGTKLWRYGAVAGKWVPKPQYHHLTNWKEHPIEKLTRGRTANNMREVNNAWKGMKTVAAPSFFFNLLTGTFELNLKDGVMPLGPKSTASALSKAIRGTLKDDPGHIGQSYRGIRDSGELPEAVYGLE